MIPRDLPWRRWISVALGGGAILLLLAMLVHLVEFARDEARKTQSRNNLKQIGLALYNYHDVHASLPPGGIVRSDNVAVHGWLRAIIPYLESSPYYRMIDDHSPWEDVENSYLFRLLFNCFLMPGVQELNSKHGYGLTHYMGNPNVLHRNSFVKLHPTSAGLSHTWLAGEVAGNYQPWGYPFNWRPLGTSLNNGRDGYGRPTGDGASFLMADASVRFIANHVDAEILTRMNDALSVADTAAVAVPSRHFEYSSAPWTRTGISLDGPQFPELIANAWIDEFGNTQTALIMCFRKDDLWGAPTNSNLQQAITEYPKMRELVGNLKIDDEAALLLAKLDSLEILHCASIKVSATGWKNLRAVRQLKTICLNDTSTEQLEVLKVELPDCEIHVRNVGQ